MLAGECHGSLKAYNGGLRSPYCLKIIILIKIITLYGDLKPPYQLLIIRVYEPLQIKGI